MTSLMARANSIIAYNLGFFSPMAMPAGGRARAREQRQGEARGLMTLPVELRCPLRTSDSLAKVVIGPVGLL